jgi:enoyl-CoA hydratase/carnithine racemase
MREIGTGLVKVDVDGHRADVVLNRPEKRNAMNEDLLSDLLAALAEVEADDDVRAITLLGEGPVFCAGMDLEMMQARGQRSSEERRRSDPGLRDVTDAIAEARVPTVVGIKRAAPAGAFELSLPADFRVISEDAKYGVIEVSLGIFPSGGAPTRLARLVGLGKAKELVLTGDFIDPEEAERLGLVNEVCEAEAVDDRARELADRLTENAPLGMERARKALNAALELPLDESLDYEQALSEPLVDTRDYTEGFTARIEGREPAFEGR